VRFIDRLRDARDMRQLERIARRQGHGLPPNTNNLTELRGWLRTEWPDKYDRIAKDAEALGVDFETALLHYARREWISSHLGPRREQN